MRGRWTHQYQVGQKIAPHTKLLGNRRTTSLIDIHATLKDFRICDLICDRIERGHFQTGYYFWQFPSSSQNLYFKQSLIGGVLDVMAKTVCCAHSPTWDHRRWCIYPAILLAYDRPLGFLPTMVGCLQSRLRILCRSFYNIVAEEDSDGNVVVGLDGEPRMKIPNPHVELPYTYLMTLYVMHCLSLMSAVQSSEDSMPFIQWLEHSNWNGLYMLMIWQII